VIVPKAAGIMAEVLGVSWIAPSALAPGVEIVPGTATSGVMAVAGGRAVGVLRPGADAVCPKVELQPNKTTAAVMKTKLRIGYSCV
jgi:hypothetical protein